MKYALDTNTVILLLRDNLTVGRKFDAAVERNDEFILPAIVHYEMRRGFLFKPAPAKENSYRLLCERYRVGEIDIDTLERAGIIYASLRRAGLITEDADILIAAFCVTHSYTLVTHNTRHFDGIDNLLTEDWAELV